MEEYAFGWTIAWEDRDDSFFAMEWRDTDVVSNYQFML